MASTIIPSYWELRSTFNFILADTLTLTFGCEGFTTGIEDPEGRFIEHMSFEGNKLFLIPAYLMCYKGCGYKFKKFNQIHKKTQP